MTKVSTWMCVYLLLGAIGCGDDSVGNQGELVGGDCMDNADCDERCERGGDFPGGVCTVSCNEDADCPDDTACIDEEGGVCLLRCELPEDCRRGYTCKGEDARGRDGEILVCTGD